MRRSITGPASTMAEYRVACSTLGKQVRVELLRRVVEGRAEGIAADGALCLRTQTAACLKFAPVR